VTVIKLRATSALTLLILSVPAAGQNSQQPVIVTPPVGDFDLPPSGQTPRPAPTRPAPSPAPTPPAIRTVPVPTASASPRPAPPRATPAPTPAANRTPAATPTARPGVPAATPLVPIEGASPVPTETAPAVESELTGNVAAAPAPTREGLPDWLWAVLGGGLLLALGGVAGWLLGRRRQAREDEPAEAVPALPDPVPPAPPPTPGPPARVRAPAPPPVPPTPPAPVALPPEGMLVTELRPLRAAIRDGLVTLDFELFIQNRGAESADNIRAVLALFGANPQQDEHIARFHASARMASGSEPFSIAPGGVFMLNGQVSLPDGQMPAVNVQGKPMFVPIVPVALRWYAGLSIKTLRDAFMVGTVPAPGSDRLGPLWVERAAGGFGPLAARRYVAKG
jgi:hypothetical protein